MSALRVTPSRIAAAFLFIAFSCALFYGFSVYRAQTRDLLPVDAMAERMPGDQYLYLRLRDEALAVHGKSHSLLDPNRARERTLVKLVAYLCVWNDFYCENLWERVYRLSDEALAHGSQDPLVIHGQTFRRVAKSYSKTDTDALEVNAATDLFLRSGYPSWFKILACHDACRNLAGHFDDDHPSPDSSAMLARPHFAEEWGKAYRELIRQGLPNRHLSWIGDATQNEVKYDEFSLCLLIAEQDRAFDDLAPGNPVRLVLDGAFRQHYAWTARGGGWASEVPANGWPLFEKRLAEAAAILEPLYEKHPDEIGICEVMMRIELGQSRGRERMELWFRRGIRIDPGNFRLYTDKMWYLQPRWHGSLEDILAFGREAVATENWKAKIPMVLVAGIASIEDDSLYARPDIWADVEKTYRNFLSRYPASIEYRTRFANRAYMGHHFDVAREQLRILGNDWQRNVIPEPKHAEMLRELGLARDGKS